MQGKDKMLLKMQLAAMIVTFIRHLHPGVHGQIDYVCDSEARLLQGLYQERH